jgi:3-hydroxyacyl-[acyl-carrier-protein] dehydratase
MNDVRFRYPVYPGDRLIVMIQLTKLRPNRRAEFDLQGFVGDRMTFSGSMIGVPISKENQPE